MKIELETANSDGRTQSEVLKVCWVFGPTFLTDDRHPDSDGSVSLFVRRYRLLRTPKNGLVVRFLKDVWTFKDEEAMAAKIKSDDLGEMPDDDPESEYVPSPIRAEYIARTAG